MITLANLKQVIGAIQSAIRRAGFWRVGPPTEPDLGKLTVSHPEGPLISVTPEAMRTVNFPGTTTTISLNNLDANSIITVSTAGGLPADFPYANSDQRSPEEARRQMEKRIRTAEKRNRTKKIAKASKKRNRK